MILRSVYGLRHCRAVRSGPNSPRFYDKRDLDLALRVYPGLRAISGHPLRPFADLGEAGTRLRWGTILRDPVERYYSAYRYHCVVHDVEMPFREWCARHGKVNTQVRWIAGEPDVSAAKELLDDFVWVGDQADLDTSLALLAGRLDHPGFPTSAGQVVNPTAATGEGYDRQLAMDHNELDIELYDHFREVIWPRQQSALPAGPDVPYANDLGNRLRHHANRAYHGLVYKRLQARAANRVPAPSPSETT